MPDREPQPLTPDDLHRHELQTHVTVISGRAQLLRRRIARHPSLTPDERDALQAGLDDIDAATRSLSARIDGGPAAPDP